MNKMSSNCNFNLSITNNLENSKTIFDSSSNLDGFLKEVPECMRKVSHFCITLPAMGPLWSS